MWDIADANIGGRPAGTDIIFVHLGHDTNEGTFTRTVTANDADLGARVEGKPDILENFLAINNLVKAFNCTDILVAHVVFQPDLVADCLIPNKRRHPKEGNRRTKTLNPVINR